MNDAVWRKHERARLRNGNSLFGFALPAALGTLPPWKVRCSRLRFNQKTIVIVLLSVMAAFALVAFSGRMARTRPPSGIARGAIPGSSAEIGTEGVIRMFSATRGWAVTKSRILRTADGGASFEDVTPKGFDPSPGSAWFRDSRFGWVAGASGGNAGLVVIRTTDGGATWRRSAIPVGTTGRTPYPLSLRFTTSRHGWLLASFDAGAGSNPAGAWTTRDGGATWKQVAGTRDREGAAAGQLPRGGIKSGLGARNAETAWVTGLWYGETVWLYATRNAGRTWNRVTIPVPDGFTTSGGAVQTHPPVFMNQKAGILPVIFSEDGAAVFYATRSGGRSWAATTPVRAGEAGYGFVWSFIDARHGFVANGDRLWATTNGARTWKAVSPPGSMAGVTELRFVSAKVGWAVMDGRLKKTIDGGRHWIMASPQIP